MIPAAYVLTHEDSRIDPARVHALLSEHAYWAAGRTRAQQDRIIATSRNYAVLHRSTGRTVAYARALTDETTFAWAADVIVDPQCRGHGLGRALVRCLLEDLRSLELRRIVLKTSAQGRGLYAAEGFTALDGPEDWMLDLRGDVGVVAPTP